VRRNAIRGGELAFISWERARALYYAAHFILARMVLGARGGCFRLRYILQKSAKHFYEPLSYLLWKALCSQIVPGPGPLYTNKTLKYF
jgi:hypothetical protein